MKYAESVWMKVRGRRGKSALVVGCVYMPPVVLVVLLCYDRLKEDVLGFREQGRLYY